MYVCMYVTILEHVYVLTQLPPRVTNITCITRVTLKLINKGLLVNYGRLDFARFQMMFDPATTWAGRSLVSAP